MSLYIRSPQTYVVYYSTACINKIYSSAGNTVGDLPFRYIHNASWLSTDQVLKCTNLQDSQKCFGCCYDYPQDDCSDPACVTNLNDVVIRCGKLSRSRGKVTLSIKHNIIMCLKFMAACQIGKLKSTIGREHLNHLSVIPNN